VVQEAVQEGCRDDGIAEDLAPFGKAAVGGEDHGVVAGVDQLEEQVAAALDDRQVADLVDDQERGAAEPADALAQQALALGRLEIIRKLRSCGTLAGACKRYWVRTERNVAVEWISSITSTSPNSCW
jgi:hypothetical protein